MLACGHWVPPDYWVPARHGRGGRFGKFRKLNRRNKYAHYRSVSVEIEDEADWEYGEKERVCALLDQLSGSDAWGDAQCDQGIV